VVKVDEDKLGQLGSMGFRKHAATRALLLHRNNLEASVMWLLENNSSPRINEPLSTEELSVLSSSLVAALHGDRASTTSTTPKPLTQTNPVRLRPGILGDLVGLQTGNFPSSQTPLEPSQQSHEARLRGR